MAAPRKDNVREKIMDAAETLLQTDNLSDITLAEIAALAGVSKGTLYYHYKDKTEILFGLTDRYLDKQWDELVSWTENKEKDTSIHRLVKYVVERNVASAGIRLHLLNAAMHENKVGGRRGCRRMSVESAADYEAALTADLTENQTLLTENCGVTPTVFTYPYGFVSPAARKVVKALGFKASLTVFPGLNYLTGNPDELYGLRRFNRPSGVKTAAFMKRLDCPAAAWFSW